MDAERHWVARLRDETPLAPSVRHLFFQVEAPEGFHWLPGQYVELYDASAPSERYSYSLASAERSTTPGRFELAVRRDGSAAVVERLRVGDSLCVVEPRGNFVRPGDRSRAAVLVAAGTGVAPLRAMIQSALTGAGEARLLLLFGCRSEEELLWGNELEEWTADPRFVFVPTLSRPGLGWRGRRGYVQAQLEDFRHQLAGADVFVCGSRAMVADARRALQALGVPSGHVWAEGY